MLFLDNADLALITDLYELTMAQSYFNRGRNAEAIFSLFVRQYPVNRGYLVCCGLQDVLEYLSSLEFTPQALARLAATGLFSSSFLDYLSGVHFTGQVRAISEGRLFFANEPILEIKAPLIEAQVVETAIINLVNLQVAVASKAARCVHASGGRALVDFSLRRTQGFEAGAKVARTAYIAGFESTSNVFAGLTYGIPVSGTMAHSYVSSYPEEIEAFRDFVGDFPERAFLLIETYDAITGAQNAVKVATEMELGGNRLKGVRIDSGDLLLLGRQVRRILDEAGLHDVKMLASGGLDEFEIEALVAAGAPYDAYGVGTKMGVSADAPFLDIAYKLVRYDGRPTSKSSPGKASLPEPKQVFRFYSGSDMERDLIAIDGERVAGGEPLLETVMEAGALAGPRPSIGAIRDRLKEEIQRLPARFKSLRNPDRFPVTLSPALAALSGPVLPAPQPERPLGES